MTINQNLKYTNIEDIEFKNLYGRLSDVKQPLPLLFNGSAVEVNVDGSELWIELESDCDAHEPWIAYEINGAFMSRQMLLPGEHSICLFRNMTAGIAKTVKFYRELQAMSEDDYCKILVKGFKTDGNYLSVKEHKYKIEFIGDSITSGEGTYGAMTDTDWLAMYMSVSNNYAYMVSKNLDADYHIVSQGGWGVYCGWDNDIRHNIPSIYERTCGLAIGPNNEKLGTQKMYDFSWQPDAIVVNLGTNDASAFNQPPILNPEDGKMYKQHLNEDGSYVREDLLKVINAAVDFLKMLRKNNPKAHIVWVYGMLGYNLTCGLTEAVNRYSLETGDHNVAFINIPNTTATTYGAHMHPGVKSHEVAADVISEYLKSILE